ncbi:hypothetical protein NRIC_19430 [Enterococcus florum]|uniref:Uncharacterized protein n=1 Tax=Enterococcus florum TaxID=2480627 RepID=A0A4P5PEJ4_9ENTE|nr:hypothetical protein [Enterococcus florum]GCF94052.1 hypothetical protein NRIC_19430 [Enterococcus florum]
METYVKIQRDGQTNYYYANIQLQEHHLILTCTIGAFRSFRRIIDMRKVDYLGEDHYFGARRIVFSYGEEQYAVFQNGLAVIEELCHQLSLISEVQDYGKYPRCS